MQDFTTIACMLAAEAADKAGKAAEEVATKITKFYANSLGESNLDDSDEGRITDMIIYGKSVQDGTPTPDNPVEIQSVVNPVVSLCNSDGAHSKTAALPYTLNAIPVSSGGNVTIDGQQYIADYVDIERKKLVRNVFLFTFNGSDEFTLHSINGYNIANFYNAPKTEFDIEKGLICNRFSAQTSSIVNTETEGILINDENRIYIRIKSDKCSTVKELKGWLSNNNVILMVALTSPTITDLTDEEVQAFKDFATYYPTTNVSVTSNQSDGYVTFNYPISLANGWNYVKEQIGDTRDYIYDMDIQSAEAYVNSEYAVALTELEV